MRPASPQSPPSGAHPPYRRRTRTRPLLKATIATTATVAFFVLGPIGAASADDGVPSWATDPAPTFDSANEPAYDGTHDGKDPDAYCAHHGLVRLQQQPIGQGIDGVIQIQYSRDCQAAWARIRIDSPPPSPLVSAWPILGREGVAGTDNGPDYSGELISYSPMLHAGPGQCVTADAVLELADGTVITAPTLEDCS